MYICRLIYEYPLLSVTRVCMYPYEVHGEGVQSQEPGVLPTALRGDVDCRM